VRRSSTAPTLTRLASEADNEALCDLFRQVTMDADLHLCVERDPDFFGLYRIQEADMRCFVCESENTISGVASILAREGYLGGQRARVAYAGDLRLLPRARGTFLSHHLGPVFNQALSDLGCEVALTAVIESNEAARRALVIRKTRYQNKPIYRLLRRFSILNVQFTLPRRLARSVYDVRQACVDDIPAIAAHLARDHERRPFGFVFDAALLKRRLVSWPGLSIENFYLAFAPGGHLVGVAAPWDAQALKRYRVVAYRGRMRQLRLGVNIAATLFRSERLPAPGGLFRYLYLTHVSILDDNPDVMKALINRIYVDYRKRRYHFLTTNIFENDPLAPAFSGLQTTALAASLYTVTPPGGALESFDFGSGRPGFEVALV
jgi:hypothetical protein